MLEGYYDVCVIDLQFLHLVYSLRNKESFKLFDLCLLAMKGWQVVTVYGNYPLFTDAAECSIYLFYYVVFMVKL